MAAREPVKYIVFFEDEVSFYCQPTQTWLWHQMGRRQSQMNYSHRANTVMRLAGYLNPFTGAVHTWDFSSITHKRFAKTLFEIAALYPDYERIFVILDNWPVHFHPTVIKMLEKEPRLELVRLPTYSPWLNPIEKVRKMANTAICSCTHLV